MQACPSGDQRGTVLFLEFVELGAVDDARDDFTWIERDAQITRDNADQLFLIGDRLDDRGGLRPLLHPVQARHDLATQAHGILFVHGQIVAQTGDAGVHLGATERFVVGLFAGRHLDQWGTCQEDLGAFLDHHDVVGHARDVGAACCRVAEHQRDRRDTGGGKPGEGAEHLPARHEHFLLGGQIRTAGLHQ
ncbi:Uncharacterised protein [Mycobacteroides abscessus subsp. abscessus]|nr:Uncharacterised protein [Mycobacteroides abscessus subsp. abscessus]